MLKRILEPEVMDSPEEARDYDAMDHEEVNQRFVEDFLAVVKDLDGLILDVGTGTARIPIVLCRRLIGCELTGIDLSRQMLRLAARNVEIARLASRISL
jgi:tRNA1(Val) A37 N6-methylase TrmN6